VYDQTNLSDKNDVQIGPPINLSCLVGPVHNADESVRPVVLPDHLTAVLPPETTLSVRVMATVTILLITLVWHPVLAWFFSNQLFQKFYSKGEKWINVIFSLLLVGLAIHTVTL
jgi:hypothetical protein